MLAAQGHRGPDDEGQHLDGEVAIGHRRLAIIDLSPSGHQPISNQAGTCWMVYNGEIYNYLELKAELSARGHQFRSSTDTEVILHAYDEWGPACLARFNGMFAFALWEARRRRLFCARDRFGVKPFYYHHGGGSFSFASEIKALFAGASVSRDPDLEALARFLRFGLQDDGYGTTFKEIRQLPPGHWMFVEAGRRHLDPPTRWFSIPLSPLLPPPDREEAAGHVRELFEDAVRLRLRSDVPVGTCLSGGLDSSSIVCVASEVLRGLDPGAQLRTFSARSGDPALDEGRYIDEVVRAAGADSYHVLPKGADFVENMERVMWHQEEPFHAPSVFAQFQVMRLTRETGVTVLLDGQAGDEVFAGYHYFVPPYLADLARRFRWRTLRREWLAYRRLHHVAARRLIGDVLRAGLPEDLLGVARSARALVHPSTATDPVIGPALSSIATPPPQLHDGRDALHSTLRDAILRTPLPNYLHHEDRNSMAWSIEARVPFLDYRLVEYVTQLSGAQKICDGWTKAVLRDAMRGLLPETVRLRVDKQGFSTEARSWFQTEAAEPMRDLLTGEATIARGWVNAEWARKAADDVTRGRLADTTLAWRCASVELWARVMLDRPCHLLLSPVGPRSSGRS